VAAAPRVTIGIPVFNGARFLEEAVGAALAQTCSDLEVVIADNASTDATSEIGRDCAARDSRVRYLRFEEHVGVASSYSRTFEQCRGEYFKWAASDDLYHPTLVGKAVAALEGAPDAVLCYSRTAVIDGAGRELREDAFLLDLAGGPASTRFRRLVMAPIKHHGAHEQYGVIRAAALRRTGLMSTHAYGDRVLLAQLSLLGRFHRLPEVLFYNREHEGRSQRAGRRRSRPGSTLTALLGTGPWPPSEFWDPARTGKIVFPEFDLAGQYALAALHAPVTPEEKLKAVSAVLAMVAYRSPKYGRDLLIAAEQAVRLALLGEPPWRGGLHRHFAPAGATAP
jgi:hypothetical protein